jgi:5-methylcytosine-specific restriction endonuclease McrA
VAGISPGGDYAELLARAVAAVIAGDQALAEGELAPIAGLTGKPAQSERLPTLSLSGWPTATHPPTRNPPKRDLARVFARDSYTCVYCGRRTVFPGVLRLLSRLFPTAFPLQANWKLAETHRAYWDIATSVDHICPVSRGGDWQEVENLATACYRCQDQKSNRRLSELGWELRRPPPTGWDGLTRRYQELWTVMGQPSGDHRAWIRCLGESGESGGAAIPAGFSP